MSNNFGLCDLHHLCGSDVCIHRNLHPLSDMICMQDGCQGFPEATCLIITEDIKGMTLCYIHNQRKNPLEQPCIRLGCPIREHCIVMFKQTGHVPYECNDCPGPDEDKEGSN